MPVAMGISCKVLHEDTGKREEEVLLSRGTLKAVSAGSSCGFLWDVETGGDDQR